MTRSFIVAVLTTGLFAATFVGPEDFHPGTVIPEYGKVATVKAAKTLPKKTTFKVVFDISDAAMPGKVNRNLESTARLLNLHAEAGVAMENISLAIVVHGQAAKDLTNDQTYGSENASGGLVAALTDKGVKIYLCGQTAAYRDIESADLLPGVEISLSAMTAHALLQQDGYTLNPF